MTTPSGPRGLAQQTAERTGAPTDLRSGTVRAVTARGIDVEVAGRRVLNAAHLNGYNPAVGDPVAMLSFDDAWLVLGRPIGPGTPSDNATPGAAAGTTLLDGAALPGLGSTLASSSGATVVVPKYTCNYFHPPNHWVMVLVGHTWYSTVANDWMKLQVINQTSGAVVGENQLIQAGNNFFANFETWAAMVPPSQGGKVASLYLTLVRESLATGVVRVDDPVTRRGFMVALDMGDTSVMRSAA